MKRIKIYAILLAVAIIAGVSIFYACEKEKKEETDNNHTSKSLINKICPVCETENILSNFPNIDELINQTGIDIYALSQKDYIKQAIKDELEWVNKISNSNNSSVANDESLMKMENLLAKLNLAIESSEYKEALTYAEHFFELSYNNEILQKIDDGSYLQEIEYNGRIYKLPSSFMDKQIKETTIAFNHISKEYPLFNTLTPLLQQKIMISAYILNFFPDINTSYLPPQKSCFEIYKNDQLMAIAGFEVAMVGCVLASATATPLAGTLCVVAAVVTLMYNMNRADTMYEKCKEQYGS